MPDNGLYLNRTYLYKVLENRPDRSRGGYRQRFIWKELFEMKDFGSRNILMQRAIANNRLATIYGPQGQPLAPPKQGGEQMLTTLMDIKAYDVVDPDVVQDDLALGELAVSGNLRSASQWQAKVRDEVNKVIVQNAERVDNTMELLAIGALLNNFQWPPVDDAGSTISSPPSYWENDIGETAWTFGLASELQQDLASLEDWNGDAATADQKKYWSDTSADIIGALDVANQICIQNHGFSLSEGTILCRGTLMNHIIKNAAILNLLRGDDNTQTGARNFLTIKSLRNYFTDQLNYTFAEYDTHWTYETGIDKAADHSNTLVHYLPENKIIILPPGWVKPFMGTAPIEHEDGVWRPGIMPWLLRDPRPNYRREAGVHVTTWPVFEYLEWFTLQVLA